MGALRAEYFKAMDQLGAEMSEEQLQQARWGQCFRITSNPRLCTCDVSQH